MLSSWIELVITFFLLFQGCREGGQLCSAFMRYGCSALWLPTKILVATAAVDDWFIADVSDWWSLTILLCCVFIVIESQFVRKTRWWPKTPVTRTGKRVVTLIKQSISSIYLVSFIILPLPLCYLFPTEPWRSPAHQVTSAIVHSSLSLCLSSLSLISSHL